MTRIGMVQRISAVLLLSLFVVSGLIATSIATAQDSTSVAEGLPEGPLGEQMQWLVDYINMPAADAASVDLTTKFTPGVLADVPADQLAAIIGRLRDQLAPVTIDTASIVATENLPPTGATFNLIGRDGTQQPVSLTVDPESGLISSIWFFAQLPPVATLEPAATATAVPTETATTAATATPTAVPTETATTVPTETATELPTETPTDVPTETPTEVPTEIPTETPTETPTDVPTETPTDVPTGDSDRTFRLRPQQKFRRKHRPLFQLRPRPRFRLKPQRRFQQRPQQRFRPRRRPRIQPKPQQRFRRRRRPKFRPRLPRTFRRRPGRGPNRNTDGSSD